jgi:hypothetical protein
MKLKSVAAMGLMLIAGVICLAQTAEARHYNQSCGNGSSNNGIGWQRRPGWVNNYNSYNSNLSNNVSLPYGFNAFPGNYNANVFPGNYSANDIWQRAQRLNTEGLQIQQRLAAGNLNANQVARLQNRLAKIQNQQIQLSGVVNTGIDTRQQQLQQLLSSGSLNANQSVWAQNMLSQLQNQQGLLGSSGNLFANTGFLGNLRGFLGI